MILTSSQFSILGFSVVPLIGFNVILFIGFNDLLFLGFNAHSLEEGIQETELDPQNPNPRGAHGDDKQKDPLDEIVRSFNERWLQGWSATPEEQVIPVKELLAYCQSLVRSGYLGDVSESASHDDRDLSSVVYSKERSLRR